MHAYVNLDRIVVMRAYECIQVRAPSNPNSSWTLYLPMRAFGKQWPIECLKAGFQRMVAASFHSLREVSTSRAWTMSSLFGRFQCLYLLKLIIANVTEFAAGRSGVHSGVQLKFRRSVSPRGNSLSDVDDNPHFKNQNRLWHTNHSRILHSLTFSLNHKFNLIWWKMDGYDHETLTA